MRTALATLVVLGTLTGAARLAAADPALDRYGDPLPPGAVARLGSLYLDPRGARNFHFAPDGQTFHAAAAGPAVVQWDAATGKLLRVFALPGLEASWPWVSADGYAGTRTRPGTPGAALDSRHDGCRRATVAGCR